MESTLAFIEANKERFLQELHGLLAIPSVSTNPESAADVRRQVLGGDRIVTRPPGYAVRVEPGEVPAETAPRETRAVPPSGATALF